jgi:hypothetical protein
LDLSHQDDKRRHDWEPLTFPCVVELPAIPVVGSSASPQGRRSVVILPGAGAGLFTVADLPPGQNLSAQIVRDEQSITVVSALPVACHHPETERKKYSFCAIELPAIMVR